MLFVNGIVLNVKKKQIKLHILIYFPFLCRFKYNFTYVSLHLNIKKIIHFQTTIPILLYDKCILELFLILFLLHYYKYQIIPTQFLRLLLKYYFPLVIKELE